MFKKLSKLILSLAVVFTSFTFIAGYQPAYACSCLARTTSELFSDSKYVFLGTVSDVQLAEGEAAEIGADYNTITITVDEVYKGDLDLIVYLSTASNSAACGVDFTEEAQYVVFADDGEPGYVTTSLCSGTTMVEEDSELINEVELLAIAELPDDRVIEDTPDYETLIDNLNTKVSQTETTMVVLIVVVAVNIFVSILALMVALMKGRGAKTVTMPTQM